MNYGRLEINLLPRELRPGPVVRYTTIIIMVLVFLAIAYIGMDVMLSLKNMSMMKKDMAKVQAQIDDKSHVTKEYNDLVNIGNSINRFGRLISLASMEYVDIPLVLDRLSRILPEGVYLEQISNERARGKQGPTNLIIKLRTSTRDNWLLYNTLMAFKDDPIFNNCYMRYAEYEEVSLQDLKEQFGINWDVAGPGIEGTVVADEFVFEIHSLVQGPLPDNLRPTLRDESDWYLDFTLASAGAAGGDGTGQEPPEGVVPVEVH